MNAFLLAFVLAAPPVGLVCPASEVDLGEKKCGPQVTQRFTVTNPAGNRDHIVMSRVAPGCGCVRHDLSKQLLAPGQSADITLTVNTLTQAAGPNSWHATVWYTNTPEGGAPNAPIQSLSLTIKAKLVREVTVSPPSLAFSTTAGAKQMITVTDRRANPLTLTKVATTSPHLTATVRTAAGAQEIVLVLAAESPTGETDEAVTLFTDDPEYAELRVPVRITKRPATDVSATPVTVNLQFAAGQTELSALVQLRAGGKPVSVAKGECDHPAVRVKWSEGTGPVATVRVILSPNATSAGQTDVRVTLSEPAGKSVTIPVAWSAR